MKRTPEKLEGWSYLWWKLRDPSFNRFWLIHPCDGWRDRQTELPWHIRAIAYMLSSVKSNFPALSHGLMPSSPTTRVQWMVTPFKLDLQCTICTATLTSFCVEILKFKYSYTGCLTSRACCSWNYIKTTTEHASYWPSWVSILQGNVATF